MQTNSQKRDRENDFRGHRADIKPVDDAAVLPPEEENVAIQIFGVVTDCLKLNVRKVPKANAEIVAVISALTEVVVDMDESTDNFYKICTASGIQGYCMKEFIAVRH